MQRGNEPCKGLDRGDVPSGWQVESVRRLGVALENAVGGVVGSAPDFPI